MFVDLTEVQPIFDAATTGVTVAVLSRGTPEWLAVFAASGVRVLCVGAEGAEFLPQDAPDVLVIDAPLAVTAFRLSLLVRQLRWAKPDLVVLLADGAQGALAAASYDLSFDPAQGAEHIEDAFAVARHLLSHSRIRAPETPVGTQPAVLRRSAPRRVALFR